jgi:hypothetical protein
MTSMKMTVIWDVLPCSFVEIVRRFSIAYLLHRQGEITLSKIPENSRLQTLAART